MNRDKHQTTESGNGSIKHSRRKLLPKSDPDIVNGPDIKIRDDQV